MENFIKALSISLLMGGSFMAQAMEKEGRFNEQEKELSRKLVDKTTEAEVIKTSLAHFKKNGWDKVTPAEFKIFSTVANVCAEEKKFKTLMDKVQKIAKKIDFSAPIAPNRDNKKEIPLRQNNAPKIEVKKEIILEKNSNIPRIEVKSNSTNSFSEEEKKFVESLREEKKKGAISDISFAAENRLDAWNHPLNKSKAKILKYLKENSSNAPVIVSNNNLANPHQNKDNRPKVQPIINNNLPKANKPSDEEMAKRFFMSVEEYRQQLNAYKHIKAPQQDQHINNNYIANNPQQNEVEMARIFNMSVEEYRQQLNELGNLKNPQKVQQNVNNNYYLENNYQDDSIKEKIRTQTWKYSNANHEGNATLKEFIVLFNDLNNIPQNADVHVLDNYVFGPQNKIATLVKVGRLYNVDNPDLTLAQVGQQMEAFVNNHAAFFNTYQYEGLSLPPANILQILKSHFPNMDNEINAYTPLAREVWSRAWTLALSLYEKDGDMTAIQIIFDQAVEGHVTRGGCIQGRIDRGFVGYVSLLCKAGVNLYGN